MGTQGDTRGSAVATLTRVVKSRLRGETGDTGTRIFISTNFFCPKFLCTCAKYTEKQKKFRNEVVNHHGLKILNMVIPSGRKMEIIFKKVCSVLATKSRSPYASGESDRSKYSGLIMLSLCTRLTPNLRYRLTRTTTTGAIRKPSQQGCQGLSCLSSNSLFRK